MRLLTTVDKRLVLDMGKWLQVENHTVGFPDGKEVKDWPWLISPSYVIVFAQRDDGKFLCFRQPKYGIEGIGIAPVGGYLEPEEDPLAAARRELLEETGCEADEWVTLGKYVNDGNHGAGYAYLFLAKRARRIADPIGEDLEEQEHITLSEQELRIALDGGEFQVLAWATGAALTLLHIAMNQ
jgi:ADP-ribose pyrophosphatase